MSLVMDEGKLEGGERSGNVGREFPRSPCSVWRLFYQILSGPQLCDLVVCAALLIYDFCLPSHDYCEGLAINGFVPSWGKHCFFTFFPYIDHVYKIPSSLLVQINYCAWWLFECRALEKYLSYFVLDFKRSMTIHSTRPSSEGGSSIIWIGSSEWQRAEYSCTNYYVAHCFLSASLDIHALHWIA